MKKVFVWFLICGLLLAAGCEREKVNIIDLEDSGVVGEEPLATPLFGVTAEQVEKIGYNDNSVPPEDYRTVYTDKDEVGRILQMFAVLEPLEEAPEETEAAPGNYCSYDVYLRDGSIVTVSRVGQDIRCGGKHYTGQLSRVTQQNETELYLEKDFFFQGDELLLRPMIDAYDLEKTEVLLPPVLKKMNEKWEELPRKTKAEEKTVFLSEGLPEIDLNEYEGITYGSYSICYTVRMPSGEERQLEWMFFIDVPAPEGYEPVLTPAGYCGDESVFAAAENAKVLAKGGHYPVFRANSERELEEFLAEYKGEDKLFLDTVDCGRVMTTQGVYQKTDEAFFEKYTLLLVYVPSELGADRYWVQNIRKDNGHVVVFIGHGEETGEHVCGSMGWIISIPLEKEYTEDAESFDAVEAAE